jgi:hypothetical protein
MLQHDVRWISNAGRDCYLGVLTPYRAAISQASRVALTVSPRDHSLTNGDRHRFQPRMGIKFVQDALDVASHGVERNVEPLGDRLVWKSSRQQCQDLDFP